MIATSHGPCLEEGHENVAEDGAEEDVGEQAGHVGPAVDELSLERGPRHLDVKTQHVVSPGPTGRARGKHPVRGRGFWVSGWCQGAATRVRPEILVSASWQRA